MSCASLLYNSLYAFKLQTQVHVPVSSCSLCGHGRDMNGLVEFGAKAVHMCAVYDRTVGHFREHTLHIT